MRRNVKIILLSLILPGLLIALVAPAAAAGCFYYSPAVGYVCDSSPAPATFVQPEEVDDSMLDNRTYARMADFTNVYPEPSTAVAPVRNAGDGYLWVTVQGQLEVNGEVWYIINPGEYVQQKDLTIGEVSPFHGVEVLVQPERPFGWFVADRVRPSSAPGADPDLAYSRMARYTFFQVFDAVVDDEGWLWYDIGGGRWIKQTYVSLVDINPRPEGVGPTEYWVEIDLYEQTFAAYEGDRMVYASLVSSGLNRWPTNEGLFQVWDRHIQTKMSGAEGKVDYYFIEDVPYTMYFDYDIALHGAFWHDRFGYKHSHGCVNMPPLDAQWTFYWSAQAENDLWVWVHTSDPLHYFDKFDSDGNVETSAATGLGSLVAMVTDFMAQLPQYVAAQPVHES